MESLQSKSNSGPDTEPSKTAENGASGRARLREWLRAKQNHQQLQIGVSFRNLECIGRCVSAQPQATYISALARLLRASRSQEEVRILSDFEGLIRPGEMLLVLGRPGSGCSTFLKALSGETHGFDLGENSIINYQGMRYKTFHRNFFGQRNYLAELDVHFPELTLGQTLEFASSARANNCQNSKSHCEKSGEGTARIMASVFGLTSAYDTLMGDVLIRGVSGGEKRRTSIAEAYISGSQLQCWDNSTRGLDSLTAKRFIEVLRQSTDALQSTVAMSLYQASESMYMNFDKVILLYEGHEIFFGPINTAVHYFTNLGFARPRNATTPDFLTSLTNPPEHVAQEGWRNRLPRSRDDFVAAWKSSNQAKSLRDEILTFESMHPFSSTGSIPTIGEQTPGSNVLSPQSPTFSLQIHGQIIVCLKRAFHRLRNNFTPVLSTIIANAILGIVIGSAFYDLGEDSLSLMQRSTLLFFVTMLNSFVPAFEIDIMWAQRPIVEKHHRYAFYHPFAERVAFMISDFPAKVALSFMLHLPVYFMANLRRTSKGFFVYWFFMLVNLFTMAMLFRMIGAISKSRDGTMTPVSILTLLCVLYTGFVVPPPYMVPWLGWFRYINPIAYTYESLMVNELHHRQFPCSTIIPDGPAYVNITKADRLCAEVGRHTGTDMVDGTDFLALKYGYTEGHLWRNMAILLSMMVAFFIVHLLASEYISAQKSRGEVLIFNKPIAKHREDEEAAMAENTARPHDSALGEKTDNHERHGHLDPMNTIHARYQSSIFHWNDLAYSVKIHGESRKLLADISGWLKPGSLTALMGATGAGKTTLLDVLAGRALSGEVSGDIFIDGRPRDDTSSFRRRMAYVQQNDIHLPTATVREALQFSALLRQSNARSKAEKLDYVEDVLKMLDMEAYADAVVGVPGEGLNVEQRKRLSIGVEMAAMPDLVLFLDEPTSGLDSQTAWSICMLLRKLVDNGHTILCTIHQPSSQLFNQFDRLILLKNGESVYFGEIGPNTSVLREYFQSKGSRKCLVDENPAEWMMDVVESSLEPDESHKSWSEKWKTSQENEVVLNQLASIETCSGPQFIAAMDGLHRNEDECATPTSHQLLTLLQRVFRDQWRDPVYMYTKTAVCIGLSLINGVSFYKTDNTIQGLTDLLFSSFLVAQLFSILSMLVIPRFINGRHLFEVRERDSGLYSWIDFVAANIIVEVTWLTLISIFVFVCWYYPTGMYRNGNTFFDIAERGGLIFMLIWTFVLWASTLSQVFSAIIEQPETAIQMSTLCFWLSLVFCGILVTPNSLSGFWTFMYRVSPLTYFLEGLSIAGISGIRVECSQVEMLHIPLPANIGTCGKYMAAHIEKTGGFITNPSETNGPCIFCPVSQADDVLRSLGMGTDKTTAWRNVGIMICYVAFDVLAVFLSYYLLRVPGSVRRSKSKLDKKDS